MAKMGSTGKQKPNPMPSEQKAALGYKGKSKEEHLKSGVKSKK